MQDSSRGSSQRLPVGGRVEFVDEESSHGVGRSVVTRPRQDALVFRTTGYLSHRLTQDLLALSDAVLASVAGKIHGFYDWRGMTGYAPHARMASVTWMLATRHRFAAIHIDAVAPSVLMASRVANLAFGDRMHIGKDRARFEAALAELLASPPAHE